MRDEELLGLLRAAAEAVGGAIKDQGGRGLSGRRPTQYVADVVADNAALGVLVPAGLRVVSEESGSSGDGELVCVLDPIDGSTNFDRGIPFFSTSMCVLDGDGMRCSVVVNHATSTRYEASRGGGATRNGAAIHTSGHAEMRDAVIAFSGLPTSHGGWAQFRALGSASLELCGVADGSLDAYAVVGSSRLSPWDYLGGMLVVIEAGGAVIDPDGTALVESGRSTHRVCAASTSDLATQLVAYVERQVPRTET